MVAEQLSKTEIFLATALSDGRCSYSFSPANLCMQEASTEATAWAAIAICHRQPKLAKKAIDFLIASQNKDGGWSTGPDLGKSDWTSGPATLAIRLVCSYQKQYFDAGQIKRVLTDAFHYLINSRTDFLSPVARLLLLLSQGTSSLHYGRGWPWTAGCYNWVEPTAYSLMAFKLPDLIKEDLSKRVVYHANKFLLEHSCRGGGWNHGSFYCLGQSYPPYVVTTAEALLGLIDIPMDHRVKASLDYLSEVSHKESSAMSLAWTILALDAHNYNCQKEIDLLVNLQNKDGGFGMNYFVTALSLLALNTVNGINYFKVVSK